jgi:hypothetical protein
MIPANTASSVPSQVAWLVTPSLVATVLRKDREYRTFLISQRLETMKMSDIPYFEFSLPN